MSSILLSDSLKKELISIPPKELTISFIVKNFGYTTSMGTDKKFQIREPKFKQNMKVNLGAGEYINKKAVSTNVGIILFNKLMIEGNLEEIVPNGFFNEVITKKKYQILMTYISEALNKGVIKIDPTLVRFLSAAELYGLKLSSIFSPSYTMNLVKPLEEISKEKEKLLKENPPETIQDMSKLEDSLVAKAREILKDDPGMTLFDSGSRGSFDNDYKNMSLMVGPVFNPVTNKFDLITSNYTDGLQKKDLVAAGNVVVTSEYPKAVGTEVGGYLTKQFYAVYQSIVVDDPNTECGTKETVEVFLDEDNIDLFLYQNMVINGKVTILNHDNQGQYVNKKVKFRSPMYCISDKICSVCAGKRPEMMDISNLGLVAGKISNNLMNKRMKQRHNMKVTLDDVDLNTLLIKNS